MRLIDVVERIAPALAAVEPPPVPVDADLTPAAALVTLAERGGEAVFGLTRRAQGLNAHPGQISFPGGKMEPDEAPLAAALREAEEEIGLSPAWVTVAGFLQPARTSTTGFVVWPVVGVVDDPARPWRLSEREVAELFWAPVALFVDPARRGFRSEGLPGETVRRPAVRYDGREVWGLTLRIIDTLLKPLAAT
jgi:8-oxo-dGTP pyrophosphatase MutT (NUDIX family)